MAHYEILSSGAGPFRKGQVVTEQEIKDAGHDLKRWQALKAVQPASAKQVKESEDAATRVANVDDPGRSPENTTGEPRRDVSTAASAPARPTSETKKK